MKHRHSLEGAPIPLYLAGIVCLCLIAWSAAHQALHPDPGMQWSFTTGEVTAVIEGGPAWGRLVPGDRLVRIDGQSPEKGDYYRDRSAGMESVIEFRRGDETGTQTLRITLAAPSLNTVMLRLVPVIVALAFWIIGFLVLLFGTASGPALHFYLFSLAAAATLAAGAMSSSGSPWIASFFYAVWWWLGGLLISFHTVFPTPLSRRKRRPLMTAVIATIILGMVTEILAGYVSVEGLDTVLRVSRRLWLALGLVVSTLLLVSSYRRTTSQAVRKQILLVVIGGLLGLMPLLVLSLLPDTLFGKPFVPYEVTFCGLIAIPAAYGYAVLHYKLIHLDRYVSRAAVIVMSSSLLLAAYLITYAGLQSLDTLFSALNLIPPNSQLRSETPAVYLIADLSALLFFSLCARPLYDRFAILANRLFYGSWYDYHSAVETITQRLEAPKDARDTALSLCNVVSTTLQLECACLFLLNERGDGLEREMTCGSCTLHQPRASRLDPQGTLGSNLRRSSGIIAADRLRESLRGGELAPQENDLVNCSQGRIWLPLVSHDRMFGVMLLGYKRGRGGFRSEDLGILAVAARQAAFAIENAQLYEEVQRHAAELEQRVAERTAELVQANASLREAAEKLQELDRMKSQFVSNVSHELRTPLANIKLYLSLMQNGKAEKQDQYMTTLNREAELLHRLIEDLLHLSRLDMGQREFELVNLDLNGLVETLVEDRTALLASHGLTLDTCYDASLPPVRADAKMITQVLTNLMTNAMNYTPAGGAVTVSTQFREDQRQAWVTMAISDNGLGISAPDMPHLFERFYRGEAAYKNKAPGTGLGLPICEEIVRRHNGRITVDSKEGQGSTFTVWLPASAMPAQHLAFQTPSLTSA